MNKSKTANMLQRQKQIKEDNTKRILKVLRKMEKNGEPIAITEVAKRAKVSRDTIYRNEDVKKEIARIKGVTETPSPQKKAKSQTEIIKSLRERIAVLEEEKRLLLIQLVEKEEKKIINMGFRQDDI